LKSPSLLFIQQKKLNTKALLYQIKNGEKEAFNTLFLRYYNDLCRFAIPFVNNGNEAEEVVQKVFIRLWENRKRLICPENEKAFLYKTVYNECLNAIRSKTTREKSYLQYFLDIDTNASEKEINPDLQQLLNRAIEKLPAKCRQIFILNKIEGLTQKEIADFLGISTKTVENQVANAISKLRVELKPLLHLLPAGLLWIIY